VHSVNDLIMNLFAFFPSIKILPNGKI
jgi:hypothetical protein